MGVEVRKKEKERGGDGGQERKELEKNRKEGEKN